MKKFGTETALSIHRKREHPELVFHCENCNYKTMKSSLFQYHKKVCGEDTTAQCPICYLKCEKKLMKKHYLEIHQISKFQCDLCSHVSDSQDKLTLHINAIHLELKNFKCEKCDFKTGWPSAFRNHEKICGSEPKAALVCNLCEFKGSKVELKTHLKTVHRKKEKLRCERYVLFSNFTLLKPSYFKLLFFSTLNLFT